jgi:hypothetical protein
MLLMQSVSSQSRRKAVSDGFGVEDAGTCGTSRRRYRPCLEEAVMLLGASLKR